MIVSAPNSRPMRSFFWIIGSLIGLSVAGCQLQDGSLDPNNILTIEAASSTALADGQTRVTLTATLGQDADPNLSVIFRTDAGTLAGTGRQSAQEITIPASLGTASAELITSTAVNEKVLVSAEIQGINDNSIQFKAFDSLAFTRALPEEMLFSADRLSVPADQFTTAILTVSLFRAEGGQVSDGSLIRFSSAAVDTSLAEVSIPDFVFADQETASIEVKSLTTTPGEVSVTAETESPDGSLLQKTIILTFTE